MLARVRMAFLARIRKRRPAGDAGTPETPAGHAAPAPRRRPLPPPGKLRRERRALLNLREERIRDLGGVVLEMFRRDRFREDLLFEQAAELMNIEERLLEVDALLAAATASRRQAPAAKCECGAPILWGSHFCGNCGRPVADAAVAACTVCGHALAAGAQFCSACGTPAETMRDEASAISGDAEDIRSA
jgi:hypothetical protein